MNDDLTLLQEYARSESEVAFNTLVSRHVDLVYSAALRRVGAPHLAEEVTQTVFIILARKAGTLGQKTILPGWLCRTARYASSEALRQQRRRQYHEQEAAMQPSTDVTESAETWRHIAPHLDEAMRGLGQKDHDALVLRYFQNRNFAEVGTAMGASEDAAKMRVGRALEKLRRFFTKRGLTLSGAAIAVSISVNSVQATPAGVTAKVSLAAGKGLATTHTLSALVKGTMKTMTWLKLKFGISAAVVALIAGGLATVAVSQTRGNAKSASQKIVRHSYDAYAALKSYSDICNVTAAGGGSETETTGSINLQRPKSYRVEWTQGGGSFTSKGALWSDGNANFKVLSKADVYDSTPPQKMRDMFQTFGLAAGVSGGMASSIPCAFYKQGYGDKLGGVSTGGTETSQKPNEKVGDTDCYVIVSVLDASKLRAKIQTGRSSSSLVTNALSGVTTTTFWIGKADYLIRKIETRIKGSTTQVNWTDDMLKGRLSVLNKPVTPENIAAEREALNQQQALSNQTGYVFTETHGNIQINPDFAAGFFSTR
ncbi:MAG: sigma-70 family RNA polymerase sigma factor [Verrucomicrobiae bacterium]|nr:sigma-70 family RNA polymerase sigma factor [Verrucomicrobiae bacterium]